MKHETFNILTSESQGGVSSPEINHGASTPLGLVKDLGDFLQELRDALPDFNLTEDDNAAAEADIATIETQLASPRPKNVVMAESLKSLRTIAESAAGNMIASAGVHLPIIIQWINALSGSN